MNRFGTIFGEAIDPFLANLQALLVEAARCGVSDFPAVVSAQAVYDDVNGFVAYIPFIGNDLQRNIAEVQAAIASVTTVLQATPGAIINLPRPDAKPPATYGLPDWVVPVAIGAGVLYGLSVISSFVPRRRVSGYRRRSKR